jgi:hypothetical protein
MNIKVKDFIGDKAVYDEEAQTIWGEDSKGGLQMLLNVRGWGAIQNLFKNKKGQVDEDKAIKFQDDMGKWIADAISEKLEREKGLS